MADVWSSGVILYALLVVCVGFIAIYPRLHAVPHLLLGLDITVIYTLLLISPSLFLLTPFRYAIGLKVFYYIVLFANCSVLRSGVL